MLKKYILLILLFANIAPLTINYASAESNTTTVTVTEDIPWAWCTLVSWTADNPETRKYTCTIQPWLWSVLSMARWLIKYVAFLAILVIVLLLWVAWFRLSIDWKKDEAKKLFTRTIQWIIILFLMWFILNTIAPWIYK